MGKKSKSTQPALSWADAPAVQDYPAAASFLRLIAVPALAESLSSPLSRAALAHQAAKEFFRAARLPLLPADDPEITKDFKESLQGHTPVTGPAGPW